MLRTQKVGQATEMHCKTLPFFKVSHVITSVLLFAWEEKVEPQHSNSFKWNSQYAWRPFSAKGPHRWGSRALWPETGITIDMTTCWLIITPPPASLIWLQMGSLPIITDNKLHSLPEREHQVKYYTNQANSPPPGSVWAYVCLCSCVCAGVDTGQALTNRAENETSPLIKRSHIESHTVVSHWTHT